MHCEGQPRRTDKFLSKDLGDEFLIYDTEQDKIHVLNGTAREILILCDGLHSLQDLVRALADRYRLDDATARRDVEEILGRLVDLGVVTLAP